VIGDWGKFYTQHQTFLEEAYPGLSFSIFKSFLKEAYDFLGNEKISFLEKQLLLGIPFAYILGYADFFGRKFFVSSKVLIPRQETEILLTLGIQAIKGLSHLGLKNNFKIAEIGVGSGCLLLSLALESSFLKGKCGLTFSGIDISQEALEVAKINYYRYKRSLVFPEEEFSWHHEDRLYNCQETFDLILSNPPYLPLSWRDKKEKVHWQASQYEPSQALFLPDDLYEEWFNSFFRQLENHLEKKSGIFLMEGDPTFLPLLLNKITLLQNFQGFLLNDLAGRCRFLVAVYSDSHPYLKEQVRQWMRY